MNSGSVSEAKLSYDLYTDYQDYKTSTAVLIRWLVDNGDVSLTRSSTLASVKQLMNLAQMVKDKGITAPNNVFQALKSSIEKRRKITAFFKSMQNEGHTGENEVTRSHEYFTLALIEILKILQKDVTAQSLPGKPIGLDPQVSQIPKPANIFEVLEIEGTDVQDRLESLTVTSESTPDLRAPVPPLSQATDENVHIEDDPMAEILGIFFVLLELDSICSAVKMLWEQAGAGIIPVVLASWISTAALKGVERWLDANAERLPISEHHVLVSKYVVRLRVLGIHLRPTSDIAPKHTPFTTGHGLSTAWIALEDFKSSRQHNEKLMSGGMFENPTSHITVQKDYLDGPRQMEAEHITMDLVLKSVKQLLCIQEEYSREFAIDINPLIVDIKKYLDSDRESVTTTLVFGMQLLVESFKSFRFGDAAIQGANCRTLALRFAHEVNRSLKAVIANENSTRCKCPSCGGVDIYNQLLLFGCELVDYVGQKRYDLYYQTPWVAGSHMQEILSLATYYGLQLCDEQKYLTATLHLYNLLVQLGTLQDKIPLLENLCDSLGDSVFKGSRPSRKYHSHFIRCIGGRLEFSDNPSHSNQACRLKVPMTANQSEQKRQLVPGQISRFYDIENCRYRIDNERWTAIYQVKKETKATRQENAKVADKVHSNSFAVSLLQLKDYAASEFSGDFPVARIDFFAVHLGCMRVLERLASSMEYHIATEKKPPPADIGFRLVTDTLRKVDEDQKDSFTEKWLLPHLSSLRISKDALIEVLGGEPLSDFLWQEIAALKG